ncbi:M28 family metallopeptidase [Rivibacter subsaxonicus]|uniref:Zn-dependent M28 family amino/carboxypeptidase n=1 Tax=Rivibacter subsaxonicus TaxID=457575 RepID=A0A4Q7VNK7_9BURK|nr:M28 family metallopeptidase [Rivibacter subsaxonicus]RZT97943.1 Zn-dependent M28 family amino/carboxypeptidase [Rivibacter subsaxonicus]
MNGFDLDAGVAQRRRQLAGASALAAALVVAGCGGGSDGDEPASASSSSAGAQAATNACAARVNNTFKKLLECVGLAGVRAHQAALQTVANGNGGNRAAGTTGYDASVDYIVGKMSAAGYVVSLNPFAFVYNPPSVLQQTAPVAATYATGTFTGSGFGSVTASVTPVDINLVPPRASTSGCEATDFAGFPVGNIALIQRGTCSFAIKAVNAQAAGAGGVIIFNQGDTPLREGLIVGTLAPATVTIPVVGASFADGSALAQADSVAFINAPAPQNVTQYNVIAESRDGDPGNVVMVGAHLDSVQAGPGINDNGSGSAAILETALQMAKVKPRNKLRFAWWGGEESGLVGSTAYVAGLSESERQRIALYLNFDMVGSPNHVFFIYDGDNSDGTGAPAGPAGSAEIEQAFEQFYRDRGVPFKGTDFSGRSDYGPFIALGVDIPAGGLFTGAEGVKTAAEAALWGGTAGQQYDPCYHLACDTYANNNDVALDTNADAIAYTTLLFSMNTESVNGKRGKGNFSRPALKWPEHPPQEQ